MRCSVSAVLFPLCPIQPCDVISWGPWPFAQCAFLAVDLPYSTTNNSLSAYPAFKNMDTNPADLARKTLQPAQEGSSPPIIEKVKDTLGMGSKSQSGTEPVSGETGEGTVDQPYDQGNQEGEFEYCFSFCQGVGGSGDFGLAG